MKQKIKRWLSLAGLRLLREPPGTVMGHDLWRDLGLLLPHSHKLVCIDGGANHGEITEAILQMHPTAHVHAFEPSPECQSILRARFANRPEVTLVASGLGNENGVLEFHRYANDELSSFLPLQAGTANPFHGESELALETMPLTTLNRYADQHGLNRIDLLKIDTQGYDLRVLQGSDHLFQTGSVNHVLVELNFLPLYDGQPTPEEIITFLRDHGLRLVDFYEKCRREQCVAWCTALFRKASL